MSPGVAMTAETERLIIRPVELADAVFLLRLLNEPSWVRYIGDKGVHTVFDAERYIESGPIETYRRYGFGMNLVALKNDATPIGVCGLVKRDALPEPDLGFALLDAFNGHGYAYEAASAVMAHARTTLRLPRVLAITTVDNDRSGRLLTKLGFAFERLVRFPPADEELKLYAAGTPGC